MIYSFLHRRTTLEQLEYEYECLVLKNANNFFNSIGILKQKIYIFISHTVRFAALWRFECLFEILKIFLSGAQVVKEFFSNDQCSNNLYYSNVKHMVSDFWIRFKVCLLGGKQKKIQFCSDWLITTRATGHGESQGRL